MGPREFFQNMPDEVFNMWLLPTVEKLGWPFGENDTDVIGTDWQHLFGVDHDLKSWRGFFWCRAKIDISTAVFHENTLRTIDAITRNGTGFARTFVANIKESKTRFNTYAEFARINRDIPAPVLATVDGGEIVLIDGHHRLAGLFHSGPPNPCVIKAWVPTKRI